MRKYAFLLAILLQGYYAICQNKMIDSLVHLNKTTSRDSVWVQNTLQIVSFYMNHSRDSSIYWIREGETTAKKINDQDALNRFLQYRGILARREGSYDQAIKMFHEVVAYWELKQDSVKAISVHISLGNLLRGIGLIDSSLVSFHQALRLAVGLENSLLIGGSHLGIGNVYFSVKDYSNALKHFHRSRQQFELINQKKYIASVNNNIGNIYFQQNKFDSAHIYYEEALAIKLQHQTTSKASLADSYINLGNVNKEWDRLKEAKSYYLEAKSLYDQVGNIEQQMLLLNNLGSLETRDRNFQQATGYLAEGRELALKHGNIEELKYNWYYQYKLDSILGNFQSALTSMKNYHFYQDSMENVQVASNINELEAKYESEQKDQEIKNLSQEATIQTLQLVRRSNQLIIGGLLAGILLIGGYLYYRNYRIKREKAAMELEQRFLRSQLNPHFVFNSMTGIQQFLLTQKTDKASHYLGVMSSLMRQILEHSRQEFISLSDEIDTLKNYLELQKLRFADSFEYEIFVDDELDEHYEGVPPMFAQPFIENSIEHGLFKKEDGINKVIVRFNSLPNGLIGLEIEDTGIGYESKVKKAEHESLATKITSERLAGLKQLVHQKLQFFSENIVGPGGKIDGLKVSLILPKHQFEPV